MTYTYEYERPSVTTDAVVFTLREGRLALLLIERAHEPFAGYWALPGGFLDRGETLDQGVRRELVEETGVELAELKPFANFSKPGRDPRGWTITAAYLALTPSAHLSPKAQSDAAAVKWHFADALPDLAFDHAEIIAEGLKALRQHCADYRPLFAFFEHDFTFADFHAAHDAVTGTVSDRRNLHKILMASGLIEETGEYLRGNHRPARLYRYTGASKD